MDLNFEAKAWVDLGTVGTFGLITVLFMMKMKEPQVTGLLKRSVDFLVYYHRILISFWEWGVDGMHSNILSK